MTDDVTIRTHDGREVALSEATWDDLQGTWEADGSEELQPPLPLVTLTHEMTRREGAAQHAGLWYHADRDAYTQWLECVLLLRRRSRALFAQGEDRPVCASNDGEKPLPNQRVWSNEAPERWQTTNGAPVFMPPIRDQLPNGPAGCAECPFAGHRDDETGEYTTGVCRVSVQFLVQRTDGPGGLAIVRLSSSQARGLERFIRQRMRSRARPLFSMKLTIETKRVPTRAGHAYELLAAGEDLPVQFALGYQELLPSYRDRFGGDAALAAPAGDPETGEVLE